jgi:hypothetical protein
LAVERAKEMAFSAKGVARRAELSAVVQRRAMTIAAAFLKEDARCNERSQIEVVRSSERSPWKMK